MENSPQMSPYQLQQLFLQLGDYPVSSKDPTADDVADNFNLLRPLQRQIFRWKALGGSDYAIAEKLDVDYRKVRREYQRAIKTLQRLQLINGGEKETGSFWPYHPIEYLQLTHRLEEVLLQNQVSLIADLYTENILRYGQLALYGVGNVFFGVINDALAEIALPELKPQKDASCWAVYSYCWSFGGETLTDKQFQAVSRARWGRESAEVVAQDIGVGTLQLSKIADIAEKILLHKL